MKRSAFFISDGTGITAETLGHSLLSQFRSIEFEHITVPYVDTQEKAHGVVAQINKAAANDNNKPIIFDTIINQDIRAIVAKCNGFMVDIFATFLQPLEQELQTSSSYTVGQSHAIVDESSYKIRIEAVHYALDNDDGARTRNYPDADIILTGVSRSGKTPTCLYLALQFGLKAANYPLTEDDLDDLKLPKVLKENKHKIFGLTIDPNRLTAIRSERKANTKYASARQCEMEIRAVQAIFNKENIPYLDASALSIEEISTRILAETGIERRLQG